jgi:serine/threonine-protein kinase
VKVLDFGISKMTGKLSGPDMTHTSVIMGTPFYMSPEQLKSTRGVDARSDIWSLGVILYELLAGDPPFEADTMPELVHRTISEPPPPLRIARPDAPVDLEKVILKCLEKDPSDRFPDVTAFASALSPFGPGRSLHSLERISGFSKILSVPADASFTGAATLESTRSSDGATNGSEARTIVSFSATESRPSSRTILGVAAAGLALATIAWLALREPSLPVESGATTADPAALSGVSPVEAPTARVERVAAPRPEAAPAPQARPASEAPPGPPPAASSGSSASAQARPPAIASEPPSGAPKPAPAPAMAPKTPSTATPPQSGSSTPPKPAPGVEALINERL